MEVPNKNINLNDWKDYILLVSGSYSEFYGNVIGFCTYIDVNALIPAKVDKIRCFVTKEIIKQDDDFNDIYGNVYIELDGIYIGSDYTNTSFSVVNDVDNIGGDILSIKAIKIK